MRKVFLFFSLVFLLPLSSMAEELPANMLEQLHNGICKDHPKPELCKRIVGIIMKSVQHNDNLYNECLKNKPASPEEAMYCQNSKALREKIDSYK
ncbi:hypothetical protein [Lonsdalea quercina]|uniref:hypothetical protein n=1 Tax=Lonsdalea quercina TaxID=71657 RepID=UPI003976DD27